jgi:hypothetical protein
MKGFLAGVVATRATQAYLAAAKEKVVEMAANG